MTKLYNELATHWYQLLSPVYEYEEEAELYHKFLKEKLRQKNASILELGCGAGHIAYYLKQWYQLTLSDLSTNMLGISKMLNPECEHFLGDMRTLRLNRTFDVVFIHDAIMYMTSEDDLKQALSTAFLHCKPGGLALISPDYIKETFLPGTEHGGSDGADRGLRYLAWTHDPDTTDSTYTVDYAYLMRDADGSVHVERDQHIEGLFKKADWLMFLKTVGFEPHAWTDSMGRVNFTGHKTT